MSILLYKPRRASPLQAVNELRRARPELRAQTIGYAGRLDPLAEGLLLLLVGDENSHIREFRALDKTYEIDVLFGLSTDSYDLAGRLNDHVVATSATRVTSLMTEAALALCGTREQTFPPFSAVKVDGHPAFYWARRGEIPKSGWPKRDRTIHRVELLEGREVSGSLVLQQALADIASLQGEFRQAMLTQRWNELAGKLEIATFFQQTLRIECSSGTFMRAIAHELGEAFGTGALTTRILRTRVGTHRIEDAEVLSPTDSLTVASQS